MIYKQTSFAEIEKKLEEGTLIWTWAWFEVNHVSGFKNKVTLDGIRLLDGKIYK